MLPKAFCHVRHCLNFLKHRACDFEGQRTILRNLGFVSRTVLQEILYSGRAKKKNNLVWSDAKHRSNGRKYIQYSGFLVEKAILEPGQKMSFIDSKQVLELKSRTDSLIHCILIHNLKNFTILLIRKLYKLNKFTLINWRMGSRR